MKKILLSLFLGIIPFLLLAVETEILPESVQKFNYSVKTEEYDSINQTTGGLYLRRGKRTSLLEEMLDRNNLDSDSVSGSMSIKETRHEFFYQYGISDELSFGVMLPWVINERSSSLSIKGVSSQEKTDFVDKYQSAKSEGLGDIEFWLSKRWVYTDAHDLTYGLALRWDNGEINSDKNDKMPLGGGNKDYIGFFRWVMYDIYSSFKGQLDLLYTKPAKATIRNSDGKDVSLERGSESRVSYDASWNYNSFTYGAGVGYDYHSKTEIDSVSQEDGYIAYDYSFFLNYGNLNKLDIGPVKLPWDIGIRLNNTLGGVNAPDRKAIKVDISLYF